jgi:hypothetical protein
MQKNNLKKYLSIGIVIFSSSSFIYGFNQNVSKAKIPNEEAQEYKYLNIRLAFYLKDLKETDMWGPFFEDDYARLVNCETYYQYGIYPQKYPTTILYRSQLYWNAIYKGQSDEQITSKYTQELEKYSLIVTYKNKEDIEQKSYSDSHTTHRVLIAIFEEIQKSESWEEVDVITTQKFGKLAVYKNTNN